MIVSLDPELLARLTRLDDSRSSALAGELDHDLAAAVRRTAFMRRLFYAAVLIVALYGTVTGAVTAFDLPWWIAIGGIFALELGGVTFLSNADVRRRLGEHAAASRLLGAIIAAAAAAFNLATHDDHLLGGFYALMSVLGFVSWWIDVENKRRDLLRVRGLLPAPSPRYQAWAHWIRHPMITAQARSLSRAYPQLGLYGSLEAALITRRQQRRDAALSEVLRARIHAAAGKQIADIAVLTYDMDEVTRRLRATADYDSLTALVANELAAERILRRGDNQDTDRALFARRANEYDPPTIAGAYPDEPVAGERRDKTRGPGEPSSPHDDLDLSDSATDETPYGPLIALRGPLMADGSTTNGQPVSLARTFARSTPPNSPTAAVAVTLTQPVASRRPSSADALPGPHATTISRPSADPGPTADGRALITVIGQPGIFDPAGGRMRGVRAKSIELLVFLVIHRAGAPLTKILDAVWPDTTTEKANQRLSTCVSNLRTTLRCASQGIHQEDRDGIADGLRLEPIINTGGHYHLNPAAVAVDWWQLLDQRKTGTPTAADTDVDTARARIADGHDYPWLDTRLGHDDALIAALPQLTVHPVAS
ncbi:hypothetical protein DFJ67_7012 [Asanoa ferruginea]|uniref:DNA-binding SARP family transcriptional activator n=1 Tax=Asanoa ferruginea TaxID=53367 RepID=A0A3D9ZWL3_9ACTN|nr:hypothetical protein [Asanoa ferruginea]REG00943.1 hypothetical protein DFJ67_7012 [Asanoa ferruginea]GIF47538.1 hypothetical protein Afe04nite_20770 [Asanoa ferruginea]